MTAEIIHIDPIDCPECGAPMRLRESKRLKKTFFGCSRWPLCDGTHGAHPNGEPLGIPANAETKAARTRAHHAFEKVESIAGRKAAYKWLATVLKIERKDAHIGMFDLAMCERTIGAVTSYTRGRKG